jgi:hypothetical protein
MMLLLFLPTAFYRVLLVSTFLEWQKLLARSAARKEEDVGAVQWL